MSWVSYSKHHNFNHMNWHYGHFPKIYFGDKTKRFGILVEDLTASYRIFKVPLIRSLKRK